MCKISKKIGTYENCCRANQTEAVALFLFRHSMRELATFFTSYIYCRLQPNLGFLYKRSDMKILIFGASGATGKELVNQALTYGHSVTAFVRDPSKLNIKNNTLRVFQGDVKDYMAVENAIKGHDAVISALGVSKPLKKDPVVIEGVRNILLAMEKLNVARFVYLSFLAVGPGRKDAGFLIRNVISRIVHNEIEDHQEKEAIIKASKLEWTIIHPPKLTNGLKKGRYSIGEHIKAKSFFPTLSRADLADFMIKQLNDSSFSRKTVRIMN